MAHLIALCTIAAVWNRPKVLGVEFELLLAGRFRVGTDGDIPEAGLLAEALNRGQSTRNRRASTTLFLAHHEEMVVSLTRTETAVSTSSKRGDCLILI
jgi:hypothetical protein